ncbi:hypothetical protein BDQ17DRAFT_1434574 [Cyathus striatus]|nr:hypothetical protein BDQ17DRAFT_1434574 [Cyathus striatus]
MDTIHETSENTNGLGRGQCAKNISKLKESLASEHLNEDGKLPKQRKQQPHGKNSRPKTKRPRIARSGDNSDKDDSDFIDANTSSDESTDTNIECLPSNTEIAESLPAKMIPVTGRGSGKRKRRQVAIEVVEDEDSARNISSRNTSPTNISIEEEATSSSKRKPIRNPIYYFYEQVEFNASGSVGNPGDKHYKCLHGGHKIRTITKAMHCSLNGLIGNLKACSPVMYQFYTVLKDHQESEGISQEEIDVASGKMPLSNIKAFAKQEEWAMDPWNQEAFEQLLASYIVSCDQPFEEVERPEFRKLLEYVFHGSSLKVPGRHAIK